MMMRRALGRGPIHNEECDKVERPSDRKDNDHDHDHNDNTSFMGENRSICLGATTRTMFSSSFSMTARTSTRDNRVEVCTTIENKKEGLGGTAGKSIFVRIKQAIDEKRTRVRGWRTVHRTTTKDTVTDAHEDIRTNTQMYVCATQQKQQQQ